MAPLFADAYDTDRCTEAGVEDYLLLGRGVIRVDYEPRIVTVEGPNGQPKWSRTKICASGTSTGRTLGTGRRAVGKRCLGTPIAN
jgi:hypothetical protein